MSYDAAAGCPHADAYVHDVETRSSGMRVALTDAAVDAQGAIAIGITLRRAGARWRGELRVEGSEPYARLVEGERCVDVVTALALITVLRLDTREPEAPVAPAPPGLVAPNPVESVSEATATSTSAPPLPVDGADEVTVLSDPATRVTGVRRDEPRAAASMRDASPPDVPGQPQPPPSEPRETRRAPAARRGCSELALTPSVAGSVGYTSAAAHAAKLSLGIDLSSCVLGYDWSAGLSVAYARGGATTSAGDVSLSLFLARLSLCPLQAPLFASSRLRACLGLDAGLLDVRLTPNEAFLAEQASRPWLALGPSIELGMPMSAHWTMRGLLGASLSLVRDDFVLERAEAAADESATVTLYRPELASFEVSLGVSYTF